MKRDSERDAQGWLISYNGKPVERVSKLSASDGLNPKMCINLKGTNGSGKSNIPIYMIKAEQEEHVVYLTMDKDDKAPVAVYCKSFDVVILGRYDTACGGCDALGNTQVVKKILARLWRKDVHILYEGVIVGDIRSTFYEIMMAFRERHPRNVSFCFMGTKYKECLRRIRLRNGGKPINEDMVLAKYRNSAAHLRFYLDEGLVHCTVLNTKPSRQEVFNNFLELYPSLNPIL